MVAAGEPFADDGALSHRGRNQATEVGQLVIRRTLLDNGAEQKEQNINVTDTQSGVPEDVIRSSSSTEPQTGHLSFLGWRLIKGSSPPSLPSQLFSGEKATLSIFE